MGIEAEVACTYVSTLHCILLYVLELVWPAILYYTNPVM